MGSWVMAWWLQRANVEKSTSVDHGDFENPAYFLMVWHRPEVDPKYYAELTLGFLVLVQVAFFSLCFLSIFCFTRHKMAKGLPHSVEVEPQQSRHCYRVTPGLLSLG